MSVKGQSKSSFTGEATISRDAFVRAWSYGSLEEQGQMLFDLIGENVTIRIKRIEQKNQEDSQRLDAVENNNRQMVLDIEKQFSYFEKKWAYIAGGIAMLAILASPAAAIIVLVLS